MHGIRDLLKIYNIKETKKLSQNFIMDGNITDKIVSKAKLKPNDLVVEIGSGPGLLTRSLLKTGAKKILGVEKDERFLPLLNQLSDDCDGRLEIINHDILTLDQQVIYNSLFANDESHGKNPIYQTDFIDSENQILIIGNLPFNISTILLVKLLKQVSLRKHLFSHSNINFLLMFQKEVGFSIVSPESTRFRSRLSVLSQIYCDVTEKMTLKSNMFFPAPNVEASVVLFQIKQNLPNLPFDLIEKVVKICFSNKNKHLSNSFCQKVPNGEAILKDAGIDTKLVAKHMTCEEFISLCTYIHKNNVVLENDVC